MKVVYIAGYARIGSTLLDSALGSHPDIFSAGELTHLFDRAKKNKPCACGQPVTRCEVWGPVLEDLDVESNHAARLTRRCEDAAHGTFASRSTKSEYEDLWSNVISAVGRHTGRPILVDASKSMQFVARRASLLQRLAPDSFALIHLTRDPRASMWSVRKGGNKLAASRRFKSLSAWRSAATWAAANIVAEQSTRIHPSIQIRYEDLVRDPHRVLQSVAPLLSVSLDDLADQLVTGQSLPVGHGLAGNRIRESRGIALSPDTDWEQSASKSVRAVAALTTPVARRYGYHMSSTPHKVPSEPR